MRRLIIVLGVALAVAVLPAVSATAQVMPWLTVSPPFARPGDTVVFNVVGGSGSSVVLAFSFSSAGAGSGILLGGDFQLLASGVIGTNGTFSYPVQIPAGIEAEVFFQAGVTPPGGGAMTLTNGVGLFITPGRGNGIAVPEFTLEKVYQCQGSTPNVLNGLEFRAYVAGIKLIKEAFLQGPAGFMGSPSPLTVRMTGKIFEGLTIFTPSGYPFASGFEYKEHNTPSPNLGYFPDGTYTINVTFADGATASTSVVLGGSFPAPVTFTSPTCGQANMGRNPTIQFTGTTAGQFEIGVGVVTGPGDSEDIWRYAGTGKSVTIPTDLLWPNQQHGVWVDNYAARSASGARKGNLTSGYFYTGPAPVTP